MRSSLPVWNLSSFSWKYVSTHCSSKSWSFFWSSSVRNSSERKITVFEKVKHVKLLRDKQYCEHTWSIGIFLLPLSTHTEEGVDMTQEDEGGWKDRLLVVGHGEVVALVFPYQIRNGLYLYIHIARKKSTKIISFIIQFQQHRACI